MKTKEQLAHDRVIMREAISTVRELIPNTEFIMLGVEPDGSPHGFYLKVVTSIAPEVSIEVLEKALASARDNIVQFKRQTDVLT